MSSDGKELSVQFLFLSLSGLKAIQTFVWYHQVVEAHGHVAARCFHTCTDRVMVGWDEDLGVMAATLLGPKAFPIFSSVFLFILQHC